MTFRPLPKPQASPLQALADKRRKVSTPAEAAFEALLNSLNGGVLRGKFQREWVCGRDWIVDFFFPEIRLAIEIDGEYHNTPQQLFQDLAREIEVEKFEVTVLRVSNREVFGDRETLVAKLREAWRKAIHTMRQRKTSMPTPLKGKKTPKGPILDLPKSTFYRVTRRGRSEYAGGWTSLEQGSRRVGDRVSKQYVDEGFAGSRDSVREMKRQQFKALRKK
jgi:very-short-patch-repair endonuclease